VQAACTRVAGALVRCVNHVGVVRGLLAALAGSEAADRLAAAEAAYTAATGRLSQEPKAYHHGAAEKLEQCKEVASAILRIRDAIKELERFGEACNKVGPLRCQQMYLYLAPCSLSAAAQRATRGAAQVLEQLDPPAPAAALTPAAASAPPGLQGVAASASMFAARQRLAFTTPRLRRQQQQEGTPLAFCALEPPAAGGLPASTPGLGQLDLVLSPLVPLVMLQSAGPRVGPSLPAAPSAVTPGAHCSARDGPAPKLVAQGSPAGPYTERCRGHAQARARELKGAALARGDHPQASQLLPIVAPPSSVLPPPEGRPQVRSARLCSSAGQVGAVSVWTDASFASSSQGEAGQQQG
jgi:hypothetical protein